MISRELLRRSHPRRRRMASASGGCLQNASAFPGRRDGDSSLRPQYPPSRSARSSDHSIGGGRRRRFSSPVTPPDEAISRRSLPLNYTITQNPHSRNNHNHHRMQTRSNSSSSSSATATSVAEQIASHLPAAPEFLSDVTVWGATGLLLTNFHAHLHLPYWTAISLTNVCIRTAMIPIAVRGAKAAVRFGSVSPEVQFLMTNFVNDMKAVGARGRYAAEGSFVANQVVRARSEIIRTAWGSLNGVFRLAKVNPLDVFKSPALQIPIFWYFALDLRRIIEGSDPALAQQLVESTFFWITDLTEPDPYYGLPIFTGALLYLNVETAVGRKTLSGEASGRSNLAVWLKDAFQTLAVFMPCFMAQQPSGVQLYLATSMIFTLVQSNAMRNDAVRGYLGLPPMNTRPKSMEDGEHIMDFYAKMSERQAAKAKGGFVLGEGVSVLGANIHVPRFGKRRKSSIVAEERKEESDEGESKLVKIEFEVPDYTLKTGLLVFPDLYRTTPVPFIPGMAEPTLHSPTRRGRAKPTALSMPDVSLSEIEAANRGERPAPRIEMAPREVVEKNKASAGSVDANKLKSRFNKRKGKRGRK